MKSKGFGLLEISIVLLVTSVLTLWAVQSYRERLQRQEVADVAVRLRACAVFMEEYYARHFRYKATAYSWPVLPYSRYPDGGEVRYRISFGSTARNTDNGYYVLRAVDVADGGRYVELTQAGMLRFCQPQAGRNVCVRL